jgi:hypothetical protein
MSLIELIDNTKTDKDTTHSYLETYENLFRNKKFTSTAVMEIGICGGGSIKLWHDYFPNAIIYGIDILRYDEKINFLNNNNRIKLLLETDAYNMDINNIKFLFDIIIEDGDHVLSSQIKTINKFLPLLKEDGILIIEDIQKIEHIKELYDNTPEEYKKYIRHYDLRGNKYRYDDILFVINKGL